MAREAFVTGATGFIGGHLVRRLVAEGTPVRVFVRERARPASLEGPGITVIEGSLTDPVAVGRAMSGARVVYHLAGGGMVSTSSAAGLETLRRANVEPLRALMLAARDASIDRFVHFSSISAMGTQLGVTLDEDSPCVPLTPHEIAKHESEEVARDAWSSHGVPITILRPSQVYGPGDVRSEILKLVRLVRRGLAPLFDGGKGLVPWVYVSDVVDATLAVAEHAASIGQTYIVTDSASYPFRAVVAAIAKALGRRRGGIPIPLSLAGPPIRVAEALARATGREPPFTIHRLHSMCGERRLRIAKATRDLGYSPRVGLQEGMQQTVAWYERQGLI